MAKSYAHSWGQIIGDLLELSVRTMLSDVAASHNLYLDRKGPRKARDKRVKVTWRDLYGNSHDLDYVLERGGPDEATGLPTAFIETAWRRYTRHSKNKAQEIEGALVPLQLTYHHLHPFLGVILAGEFTSTSIAQLQSRGFETIYFPAIQVFDAFAAVGIGASYGDDTEEEEFQAKIKQWSSLAEASTAEVRDRLIGAEREQVERFLNALDNSLSRNVVAVAVTALHGTPQTVASVADAISYVKAYDAIKPTAAPMSKLEIDMRYSNGDVIHASFQESDRAVAFLESFL